jgi:hypothetical protein
MELARLVLLCAAWAVPAPAATIDVLWTSGSAIYNANVIEIAAAAPGHDPAGDGATAWRLAFWDPGRDRLPDLAAYDVLVIGATYDTDGSYGVGAGGSTGFFGNGVSAAGVLANGAAIQAARGSRTLITGLDPDWHDYNNAIARTDGPRGYLINAVNWAGTGDGLGIVALADRYHLGPGAGGGWWTDGDSFLASELSGRAFARQANSVFVEPDAAALPVNEGLSTAGLSDWNTSAHAVLKPVDGYVVANWSGPDRTGGAVTLVSDMAPIPLPPTAVLLGAALAGLWAAPRRARRR